MSEQGNKGNKQLWKNLKTEKIKYSAENSYAAPHMYQKQGNSLDHTLKQITQKAKQTESINFTVSNFIESFMPNQQLTVSQELEPVLLERKDNIEKNRSRESSENQGPSKKSSNLVSRQNSVQSEKVEESLVQEIVDIENLQNELNDFEEYPMMISIGSQNNPTIRQLKLSQLKSKVEQMKALQQNLIAEVRKEREFMLMVVNEIKIKIVRHFSEGSFVTPSFGSQQQSPENLKRKIQELQQVLQEEKATAQALKQENIRFTLASPLSTELPEVPLVTATSEHERHFFASNPKRDKVVESLKKQNQILKQENEAMNEAIFDFEQKIAQIDLQINERVERLMRIKLAENEATLKSDNQKKEIIPTASNKTINSNSGSNFDREFYLNEIVNLQKEIQKLSERCMQEDELRAYREITLKEKEEELTQKQQQLEQAYNRIRVRKIELDKKSEELRDRQTQIKFQEQQLERKQVELSQKEKEGLQKDDCPSSINEIRFHSREFSGDNKNNQFSRGLNTSRDEIANAQTYSRRNGSRLRQANNGNLNYPLSSTKKSTQLFSTHYRFDYQAKDDLTPRSRSGSKEAKKILNISSVIRPRNSNFSKAPPQSYSKGRGNSDKSKLENLGSKLERLRQEIKKQIQDVN